MDNHQLLHSLAVQNLIIGWLHWLNYKLLKNMLEYQTLLLEEVKNLTWVKCFPSGMDWTPILLTGLSWKAFSSSNCPDSV